MAIDNTERTENEHAHRYPAPSDRARTRGRSDDGLPSAPAARGGSLPAAQAERGDRAGQAHREGRSRCQGPHDQLEPASGRRERAPLPGPGARAGRPHPGGHARPHPSRGEVRLAQGVPVLDLRDALDPSGHPARTGEHEPDDPAPGPRGPAVPEGRAHRAAAHDQARSRAVGRGDRLRGGPPARGRDRDPQGGSRGGQPRQAGRRRRATPPSATCWRSRRPPSTKRSARSSARRRS